MAQIKTYSGNRLTVEARKSALLNTCNDAADDHVYSHYSARKQRNVDGGRRGYGQSEKNKMDAFINAVADKCNAYETAIQNAQSHDDLDAINIDYSTITH